MNRFEDENINMIIKYINTEDKDEIFTKRRKFTYEILSGYGNNELMFVCFVFPATKRRITQIVDVQINVKEYYKWKTIILRKIKILKLMKKFNEKI